MTALAARQEVVPLTGGKVSLLLLGPLSDWMRPPTLGRTICFTQSADLNVNLIQKHFHRHTLNNVWPNIWAPHGPVQLAHKINHHIVPLHLAVRVLPELVSHSFISFTQQIHVQRKSKWKTFSKMLTAAGYLCVVGFRLALGFLSSGCLQWICMHYFWNKVKVKFLFSFY